MKNPQLAKRWLAFASDDLKIIDDVIKDEVYHLACFHAQQAVEKTIKVSLFLIKMILLKPIV